MEIPARRPLRIGLDLTALVREPTGVDAYIRNLAVHLGRIDDRNRYVVFVNAEERASLRTLLPKSFAVVTSALRHRPVRLAFQQGFLPAAATALRLDVLHSPAFLMPLIRGTPRHVLTVYDMTFFTRPADHIPLRRSIVFRRAVARSIRAADVVCVPTRSVEGEIRRLLPDVPATKLRVVPPGIAERFTPQPEARVRDALARLGVRPPYILHVGTIEPRKNIVGLVEAYRTLLAQGDRPERLVLAGRLGWGYEDLLARVEMPGLRDRVQRLGYVELDDLPALYAGARLFVYPSWEEGFGFPPLEAMACGVPTIASQAPALAENLGGAAVLVSPHDRDGLVRAMRALLDDPPERERRVVLGIERAARFRWPAAAGAVLECYREAAAAGAQRKRRGLSPGPAT